MIVALDALLGSIVDLHKSPKIVMKNIASVHCMFFVRASILLFHYQNNFLKLFLCPLLCPVANELGLAWQVTMLGHEQHFKKLELYTMDIP